jgi:hypothetical protein
MSSRREIVSTASSPGLAPSRILSTMTGMRGHVSATLVPYVIRPPAFD